jgi:2-methylfumaryl-CoA isomerase
MVVLSGSPDGSAAVDYTVNAAVGFPLITGDGAEPSNHVLPAWDVIAGNMVATAVLAAERHRTRTGEGQLVRFTLLDVALATIGHLGFIAEVEINDEDRPALGNYVYGTYGKDFSLADGSRVMVVALTPRQWTALVSATETAADMERFADDHGFDLDSESDRFDAREAISGLLAPWFAARTLPEIRSAFDQAGVCWAPYQTVRTLLASDRNAGVTNPMLRRVAQPGIGTYLAPASPLRFGGAEVPPPLPAPRLGEHTRTVLRAILGLGDDDLDELGSTGVI